MGTGKRMVALNNVQGKKLHLSNLTARHFRKTTVSKQVILIRNMFFLSLQLDVKGVLYS